jgi:hypothetical protein
MSQGTGVEGSMIKVLIHRLTNMTKQDVVANCCVHDERRLREVCETPFHSRRS